MSKFRELIEESIIENNEVLDEGIGSVVRNGLLGATMALGAMQGADAKTDPELLRSGAHSVTSKYEHGGKGYQAIVKDNYGGYSYGKEQLSTRRLNKNHANSTFDDFMKYAGKKAPYIKKALDAAGGWQAAYRGTDTFRAAWKKLADQKEFQDVYDDFILDTQVLPVFNRMDKAKSVNLDKITTWGSQNAAMQAAIRSTIIQHGRSGAFDMICDVVRAHNPANMGEFIRDLYKKRASRFPQFKSRYSAECDDVINFLKTKDSNIDMAYGHKPGQSGYELDQLINKIASGTEVPETKPEKVSIGFKPQPQKQTNAKASTKSTAKAKKK